MEKKELFWLNGWINQNELNISHNRAFLYGDGFFESMRWNPDGTCLIWDFHWERLTRTLKSLHFPVPEIFSEPFFKKLILDQLDTKSNTDQRVKVQFWRHGPGKYQPESTQLAFMLTVEPYPFPWLQNIDTVGIAETIFIPFHQLSWIKTTSSMLYVAASTERVNRDLDDVILRNENGFVIEGSYSCLFWGKGETIYLPDHQLGGLDSCMRRYLQKFWLGKGIEVLEVKEKWTEIPDVDWIGFGSGMGLRIQERKQGLHLSRFLPDFGRK